MAAKWKKAKWVSKQLTVDQRKAQRMIQRAIKQEAELSNALGVTHLLDRKHLHTQLDRRLNAIKETRRRARELFPEVEESLTIASCEITL